MINFNNNMIGGSCSLCNQNYIKSKSFKRKKTRKSSKYIRKIKNKSYKKLLNKLKNKKNFSKKYKYRSNDQITII